MSSSSNRVQYNAKDWERISSLGLHPSVTSPDVYSARVLSGMRLAQATLAATKELVPSTNTIRGLHYMMFESVHPWSGTFRQEGQEVRAGNLICSLAEHVPGDLMKLRKEMLDNSLDGTRQYKAEVAAFYHASFLAIHPFADGNGRVGRLILDAQTKRLLGHPLSSSIRRHEYIEALSLAQETGKLRPLAKLIARSDLQRSVSRETAKARHQEVGDRDGLLVSKPRIIGDGEIRSQARR